MDYIIHPLWETWSELVYPDCRDILAHFQTNRGWYSSRAQQQQNHVPLAPRLSKDIAREQIKEVVDEESLEADVMRTDV